MTKLNLTIEPGKQEFSYTRVFNASPEQVFKAYTDPAAIVQWWGPRYLTTTIEKMEVQPGGSWRFIQQDANNNEYAFHGVYHDIVSPSRIVQTFEFEGTPGHVALEILTMERQDGKTLLTAKSIFQSVEDRDGMVGSGGESGMRESLDRLDELLKEAA